MAQKILILGATGKVAEAITKMFLSETDDTRLILCTGSIKTISPELRCEAVEIDYLDLKGIESVLKKYSPACIVNAAAMTGVDACEDEKSLAMKLNCDLPKTLAKYARKKNIHLIHFSTDYIFNGEKGLYSEDDTPDPVSYYGRSKLAGENAIISEMGEENYTIFRTNVVYGYSTYGKNDFINWIIDNLENEEEINIVDGQWSNPTFSSDLAWVTLKAFEEKRFGIFNIAGSDYLSRYEIALKVCEVLRYDKDLIKKIKPEELIQKAKRPEKGGLLTLKAESVFGMGINGLGAGILQMKFQSDEVEI
jgi:dTDP-4-dehydrorhamnose reductase